MTRRRHPATWLRRAAAECVVAVLIVPVLFATVWSEPPPADQIVPAEDLAADLEVFAREVKARSAYLLLTPLDIDTAVNALRQRGDASGGLTLGELSAQLQQILTATGDPTARVFGIELAGPFLPFSIVPLQDRYVATWHDGTGFLAADKPYISSLDGDPVSIWLGRLDAWLPAGPSVYRRRIGIDYLQAWGAVMRLTGNDPSSAVAVRVIGADLGSGQDITVTTTDRRAGDIVWPQNDSGVLSGDIGYLRLPRMGSRAVDQIRKWMPKFERTKGLIVDVRGNAGGPRDALRELFPYFLRFDDPPLVVGATLYREHPTSSVDDVVELTGQPADWPHWQIAESGAIKDFQKSFAPADSTLAVACGPWRYLVATRKDKDPRYPYLNHIVVLMDDACNGSTELLLAACKGRFKIRLIGTPSGNVPDGAESFHLPHTQLGIQVSSLVTYLPDGRRLGSSGIEPDMLRYPEPESFLPGGDDGQREFARKYLIAR